MDTFAAYRGQMLACLRDQQIHHAAVDQYEQAALARVEQDRQAHPGQHPPAEYELKAVLAGNVGYELAVGKRESARRRVTMWGIAAAVEGLALILAEPPQ